MDGSPGYGKLIEKPNRSDIARTVGARSGKIRRRNFRAGKENLCNKNWKVRAARSWIKKMLRRLPVFVHFLLLATMSMAIDLFFC
jgi:hypothetical protein